MTQALSRITTDVVAPMMITWDLGRRCNFDCTYCPPHRHDNFSPHAELNELCETAINIFEYLKIMMPLHQSSMVNINFTGGEPTVNPHFLQFSQWMREAHQKSYRSFFDLEINLTSNGAFPQKIAESISQHLNFATISYHCEGKEPLKKQTIDSIRYFKAIDFPQQINVMFHARPDYFDECLSLSKYLYDLGIPFTPRMIGDHGSDDRYGHKYSPQQLRWFKDYWKNPSSPVFTLPVIKPPCSSSADSSGEKAKEVSKEKKHARSLGRPCCGGRNLRVCRPEKEDVIETRFLEFTEFEDWYCSVNWFFLHIEQQTDQVFHHQTCQANFGKKRGAIGKVSEFKSIISNLRENIEDRTLPIIRCPNKICGCGLCTPKAKSFEDFKEVASEQINFSVLATPEKVGPL